MWPPVHWVKVSAFRVVWPMLANTSIIRITASIVFSVTVRGPHLSRRAKEKDFARLGECSEGSVWESFAFGSFYKLDNLCAIIDVNRLGQSDPAPLQHDTETYRRRVEAFG